jgi:putative SOS response-associated peptidase YedK
MCRNKGQTAKNEVQMDYWKTVATPDHPGSFYGTSYMQAALTPGVPIILKTKEGDNISVDAFWGILPPWKHTFKEAVTAANSFVNIRSETVHESKLYAPLLKKKQRCLIPCTYYFEHHHFDKYNKKTGEALKGKVNVPFLVKVHCRPLFAVPALYSRWYDKENKQEILTYSMFTIVANDLLTAIHNGGENPYRMPLVIERDMEDIWLDPVSSDRQIGEILNYQIASNELRAYAVAPLTGKAAKQGEAVTEEVEWPEYQEEIKEIKNTGKTKTPALV